MSYDRMSHLAFQCSRLEGILKLLNGSGTLTVCVAVVPGDYQYKEADENPPDMVAVDLLARHRTATGLEDLRHGLSSILDGMREELAALAVEPRRIYTTSRHTRITPDYKVLDMEMSVRALNSLGGADIKTLNELMCWKPKDLLLLRQLGQRTLREIEHTLDGLGLMLCPNEQEDQFDNSRQRQLAYREEINAECIDPGEDNGS